MVLVNKDWDQDRWPLGQTNLFYVNTTQQHLREKSERHHDAQRQIHVPKGLWVYTHELYKFCHADERKDLGVPAYLQVVSFLCRLHVPSLEKEAVNHQWNDGCIDQEDMSN